MLNEVYDFLRDIEKSEKREKRIEEEIRKATEELQKRLTKVKEETREYKEKLSLYTFDEDIHIMKRFFVWMNNIEKEDCCYVSLDDGLYEFYYEYVGGNENELHEVGFDITCNLDGDFYRSFWTDRMITEFDKMTEKRQKYFKDAMEEAILINAVNIRFD